jgi:hypothetical protein
MMHLLFGKLPLLDYEGTVLDRRRPAAETFAQLAERFAGVTAVHRRPVADAPSIYAFDIERRLAPPLLVVWDQRDWFDGEDEPPTAVCLPWSADSALAVDAFGRPQPVKVGNDQLHVVVADTPVFIEQGRPDA